MPASDKAENFLTVIENNKGIIYKIANSYCKDVDDRNDLMQDIVLKLWNSLDNYDDQYKHSTWVYRIALNTAISFYRKEKTRNKIAAPLPEKILNVAELDDNKHLEKNAALLQQFIAELNKLDKALMILYLEEKSHKEMAGIMGISESNVATKINRIKKVLKQKFLQSNI